LRTIKYCAITLSTSIVLAVLYIVIFHNKDDDPAGFIAIGILTTFISIIIATTVSVFEKILQSHTRD
jgi:tryptophan-rich sensory protein